MKRILVALLILLFGCSIIMNVQLIMRLHKAAQNSSSPVMSSVWKLDANVPGAKVIANGIVIGETPFELSEKNLSSVGYPVPVAIRQNLGGTSIAIIGADGKKYPLMLRAKGAANSDLLEINSPWGTDHRISMRTSYIDQVAKATFRTHSVTPLYAHLAFLRGRPNRVRAVCTNRSSTVAKPGTGIIGLLTLVNCPFEPEKEIPLKIPELEAGVPPGATIVAEFDIELPKFPVPFFFLIEDDNLSSNVIVAEEE